MTTKRTPVYWKGRHLVGYIEALKSDNLFYYGQWIPYPSADLDAFLAAISEGADVVVQLDEIGVHGGTLGYVEQVPDDEIEVLVRPGTRLPDGVSD